MSARRQVPRNRPGTDHTLTPAVEHLHVGDTSEPAAPAKKPPSTPSTRSSGRPKSGTTRVRAPKDDRPRYLQMHRMEARLRLDQIEALASIRRRINAARVDKTERITDNTLLRVAVDLLIAHGDQLQGDNEDQLRESAGSVVTE